MSQEEKQHSPSRWVAAEVQNFYERYPYPDRSTAWKNIDGGKWSAGPAGVALIMQRQWFYGALINNQWSFAGWGVKSVNAMLLQWFVNYNLPDD
jgi:hypothetical protein